MLWTYLPLIGSIVRWLGRQRLLVAEVMLLMSWSATLPAHAATGSCEGASAGITLPDGFCATIFADNIGHARQMAFAPDGTLYVMERHLLQQRHRSSGWFYRHIEGQEWRRARRCHRTVR